MENQQEAPRSEGAERRIAIGVVCVLSLACATFALAARAEKNKAQAEQYWGTALAVESAKTELASIVCRVNVPAHNCGEL